MHYCFGTRCNLAASLHTVIPNGAGRFFLPLSLLRKRRPADVRNLSSILRELRSSDLLPYPFAQSFHSPAAVAFCVSLLPASGIPSLFAAVSSSNSSRASIAALAVFSVFCSLATRHFFR